MKIFIIAVLVLLLNTICYAGELQEKAINIADKYYKMDIVEKTGNNDGPIISYWLKTAGTSPNQPYCMSFVYTCYNESAAELKIKNPMYRTAKVEYFYTYAKKNPYKYKILRAQYIALYGGVQKGDIAVWKHGSKKVGWPGHAGMVITNKGLILKTIEANTGSNNFRDGNSRAVSYKDRDINKNIKIGFLGLVRIK